MKLLFASDIHGSAFYCEKLCACIEKEAPDRVVLLGDLLYHGPRNDISYGYDPKKVAAMLNERSNHIIAVRGNCDAEVDQMMLDFPCMGDYSTILTDDGFTFFATHGHLWSPHETATLPAMNAFVYGHTHIKQCELKDGILLLNPGSVSLPKDGSHSYAVYENKTATLKTLEGVQIKSEPIHTP